MSAGRHLLTTKSTHSSCVLLHGKGVERELVRSLCAAVTNKYQFVPTFHKMLSSSSDNDVMRM